MLYGIGSGGSSRYPGTEAMKRAVETSFTLIGCDLAAGTVQLNGGEVGVTDGYQYLVNHFDSVQRLITPRVEDPRELLTTWEADAERYGIEESIAFLPLVRRWTETTTTLHTISEWRTKRRAGFLGVLGARERVAEDVEDFRTTEVRHAEPYQIMNLLSGEQEDAYGVAYKLRGIDAYPDHRGRPGGVLTTQMILPKSEADTLLGEILPVDEYDYGAAHTARYFARSVLLEHGGSLYWERTAEDLDGVCQPDELYMHRQLTVVTAGRGPSGYSFTTLPDQDA